MPHETWTIQRCLDWTRDYLTDKGDERPRLSAEWLLSSVTGLTRTQLYMSFDKPMAESELAAMHKAVVRRAKGEPLQYIAGETAFRMINVACEPGVLIPRPETELLVEEVLAFLDQEVLGEAGTPPRDRAPLPWNAEVEKARQAEAAAAQGKTDEAAVAASDGVSAAVDWGHEEQVFGASGTADAIVDGDLDAEAAGAETAGAETDASSDGLSEAPRIAHVLEVGTGTGCISLSLAYERPERVTCVATDIEPRAIALASRNRNALGISTEVVDFREGNLVSPLDREQEWGTFDVLVSNPPYIPTQVMKGLPHEVADYEPALALDGGADGLDIFRRLVKAAPSMLRTGGLLACELYEGHLELAAEVCRQGGLEDIRIVNDLTGRPRIILARAYRVREVATAR